MTVRSIQLIIITFMLGCAVGWSAKGEVHDVAHEEQSASYAENASPLPRRPTVPFVRVVDGDTIKVIWQGEEVSVRMLRINTPERGRPGYKEATDHLRGLINNRQTVELEFENGTPERDRYGRLLAYVWLDGKNLCVEQVRAGHTTFWTKYGEGKYADVFRKAEIHRE